MTPLRQRMLEDMQVRNLSPLTQASYVQQVSLFARHFKKSPEVLGPEEIRSYQVYLTNEKKLAQARSSSLCPLALPLQSHPAQSLDRGRHHSCPQETSETTRCAQPGRGSAFSWLRTEPQASYHPHRL